MRGLVDFRPIVRSAWYIGGGGAHVCSLQDRQLGELEGIHWVH